MSTSLSNVNEFQRTNSENSVPQNEMRDVARRLHRIKRRILMEVENEGGNSQNNWRANEFRSPLSCSAQTQDIRD
jgi:hypothetical protein